MYDGWYKVEFFGRLPEGRTVADVRKKPLKKIYKELGEVFGFEFVDSVVMKEVTSGTEV